MALACLTGSTAAEWKGHLSTLLDAQVACTNVHSLECEPFLAEAVAVADILHEIAQPLAEGGNGFTVTFGNMRQETCSQNWFTSLNGLSLLLVLRASIGPLHLSAPRDSCAIHENFSRSRIAHSATRPGV
jgi:hypothetical protein